MKVLTSTDDLLDHGAVDPFLCFSADLLAHPSLLLMMKCPFEGLLRAAVAGCGRAGNMLCRAHANSRNHKLFPILCSSAFALPPPWRGWPATAERRRRSVVLEGLGSALLVTEADFVRRMYCRKEPNLVELPAVECCPRSVRLHRPSRWTSGGRPRLSAGSDAHKMPPCSSTTDQYAAGALSQLGSAVCTPRSSVEMRTSETTQVLGGRQQGARRRRRCRRTRSPGQTGRRPGPFAARASAGAARAARAGEDDKVGRNVHGRRQVPHGQRGETVPAHGGPQRRQR